ncbi:MAG: PAS domain S-box protein [Acidobacteria bacterium]|nr:PAS domain S-box protein [Acidobacteriota bacterium]
MLRQNTVPDTTPPPAVTVRDLPQDSANPLRAAFDASPFPMWIYDRATTRVIAANDAAVAASGMSREELLSAPASPAQLPEENSGWDLDLAGRPCHAAMTLPGATATCEACGANRNAGFYRTLVESSLDITTVVDDSGSVIYESPAIHTLLGYWPGERVGKSVFGHVHPEDAPEVVAAFENVVRTGAPAEAVQVRLRDARSEWRTIEAHARNLMGDPSVRGVAICSRDITDKRRAEDNARATRERLRIAQRAGRIESWEYDLNARRLLGTPEDDAPGELRLEQWLARIHPEDRQRVVDKFAQCVRERVAYEDEFRSIRPGGGLRWVSVKSEVIAGHAGSAERLVGVNIDVSETKEIEQQLAAARDEAIQGSQMKSRFLATVSHEIRTPMNAIMGLAGLLMDTPLTPEQHADMEIIRSSASHLLDLINGILDLSKAEAGKIVCENGPFDLRTAIVSALELVEPAAVGKGLRLALEYPAEIRKMVNGDAGRVRQIVLNFAANAVKFTAEGSVTVRVSEAGEDRLRISVADTGEGVPDHLRTRLFDPFVQADNNSNRRYGGTGLGLAISRWMAEVMNGSVGCSQTAGDGAEFWLEAPLPAAPGEESVVSETKPTVPLLRRGYRALVVEDNGVNQKVLARLLEKRGLRADVAANGIEAVRMWRDFPYDVVFMDCRMPEMDGYEATRHIRALEHSRKRVPIVAVTAHVGGAERQRCFACGMDGYLQKPFHPSELDEMLVRFLSPESTLALLTESVQEPYDRHAASLIR